MAVPAPTIPGARVGAAIPAPAPAGALPPAGQPTPANILTVAAGGRATVLVGASKLLVQLPEGMRAGQQVTLRVVDQAQGRLELRLRPGGQWLPATVIGQAAGQPQPAGSGQAAQALARGQVIDAEIARPPAREGGRGALNVEGRRMTADGLPVTARPGDQVRLLVVGRGDDGQLVVNAQAQQAQTVVAGRRRPGERPEVRHAAGQLMIDTREGSPRAAAALAEADRRAGPDAAGYDQAGRLTAEHGEPIREPGVLPASITGLPPAAVALPDGRSADLEIERDVSPDAPRRARLLLHGAHLGDIDITVTAHRGAVTVNVSASQGAAHALSADAATLAARLSSRGVRATVAVAAQPSPPGGPSAERQASHASRGVNAFA